MSAPKWIFVFLLLLALSQVSVYSQIDFFPPGAEWYYSFKNPGLLQVRGYTRYSYTGDVDLGGKIAKRLEQTTYLLDYDHPTVPIDTITEEPLFMAQSGDSIFYYADTSFLLLWRMNVQAGDQFEFTNVWGDIFQMNVDSTTEVILDNQEAVKMWISGGTMYGHWGHTVIYDKFGPTNGFRYYSCWGWYDCYDSSLCRYKSDATGVVDINGSYCDNLLASATDLKPTGFQIYPNPATNVIHISCPDEWSESFPVSFFNQTGQLIYTENMFPSQIHPVDVSSFVPGMYYCRVGGKVFKVVKQ